MILYKNMSKMEFPVRFFQDTAHPYIFKRTLTSAAAVAAVPINLPALTCSSVQGFSETD